MRTYLSLSVSSCRKMLWLSKAEQVVKVGNVVAIAALKHGIDLNAVGKTFLEVEYRPEQLSGLIFRLKRPRTTTLILAPTRWFAGGLGLRGMRRRL